MALLHYQNLGVRRPEGLMKSAFYGLGTFYRFLTKTKGYMESDAAVKRLSWQPCLRRTSREHPAAVWVTLKEPQDRPNEPESTFRAFLDEGLREVCRALPTKKPNEQRGPVVRLNFREAPRIAVLDRDAKKDMLLLERTPDGPDLLLRPNTWTLQCQIQAIRALQNAPSAAHLPLLRLFESTRHTSWPKLPEGADWMPAPADWKVLTEDRPGTEQQREFVQKALATPDFAILEGPPGSGKTTAICELVLQLVGRGKRVLLCASTHVAVDNVLERLMEESNPHRDLVIPIRIGDRNNVSDKARPWQLANFVSTERERLLKKLNQLSSPSPSQEAFRTILRTGPTDMERLVMDAANLVCGTTIGILQHPDLKADIRAKKSATPKFDVLIVDEASKTTFQEFLVPALLAERWIIVGDPKQLSPFVDDEAMAVNIESCLPEESARNACVDVFMAAQPGAKRRRVSVVVTDDAGAAVYQAQAEARDVAIANACDADVMSLATAAVVVGSEEELRRRCVELPLDVATVRAEEHALPGLRRRVAAWRKMQHRGGEERPEWAREISWRLATLYDQRLDESVPAHQHGDAYAQSFERSPPKHKSTAERLSDQLDQLMPVGGAEEKGGRVWKEINSVRRVALPSILESLQFGFERDERQRDGTAMSDGLPKLALEQRHVLLRTQHRMHHDIAAFSHQHIYDGRALATPDYLEAKRDWSYARYAHRAVWLEVRGGFDGRVNANAAEAEVVIEELKAFDEWTTGNPRADGAPWEVAVLTFYRGQEREVRGHLQDWTAAPGARRYFTRGSPQHPHMTIELCTVDRFQGHEADLVFISFARPHPTSFLESPNRLNVALTRARYQRVVVGNRKGMTRARGRVLKALANGESWEQSLVEVQS